MSLAARSLKYYLGIGLQRLGITVGISALIFVEFFIIHAGEPDHIEYTVRLSLLMFSLFVMLFGPMYAMYGPNWYDSNVLMMGGRRRDIFWGVIAKEIFYVVACLIIIIVADILAGTTQLIPYGVFMIGLSLPFSGIMRIIGHNIKKHGRLPVIILAIVAGACGAGMSMTQTMGIDVYSYLPSTVSGLSVFMLICLGLYGVFQIFVYKLVSKAMVR